RFRAFVAGSGPFEAPMREALSKTEHSDRVHFLGQVPHKQVLDLQHKCDVYVSLNQMCNLTNANLEAMRTGVCMIIPAAPGIRGIDEDTDELMPPDTIWRIRGSDDVDGLRDALIYLDSNPGERRQRAEEIFTRASTFIPSWDERINAEIKLLEQLATAKN
ncbi:MAG: glycosyltransferase, partial [Alphaproteobacteria bacterium]|nr:glycosyltransferase [Alphaproteobacteria bacterium]